MIELFSESSKVFYIVNIEAELLLIPAYTLSLVAGIVLREFTHGIVRHTMTALFVISYSVFCFVLTSEYSPTNFMLVAAVIAGMVSGLWVKAGRIIGSITKH